jgi:nucleoid-associated protein YgaU
MTAVVTTEVRAGTAVTRTARRATARPVARRAARPSGATCWRRRVAAGAAGLVVLVAAGKAGAALGGSPLAVPERHPAVTRYVVQPGDSLWSIAQRIEPGHDPRPVVDALATARGDGPLVPGEVLTWSR